MERLVYVMDRDFEYIFFLFLVTYGTYFIVCRAIANGARGRSNLAQQLHGLLGHFGSIMVCTVHAYLCH